MAKDKESAMSSSSSSKRDKKEKAKKKSREMAGTASVDGLSASVSRKSSTDGVAKPSGSSKLKKDKKGDGKERKKSRRKEDAEDRVLKELEEKDGEDGIEEKVNGVQEKKKKKKQTKEDKEDKEKKSGDSEEESDVDVDESDDNGDEAMDTSTNKTVDTVIRSKGRNDAGKRKKNEDADDSSEEEEKDDDDEDSSSGEMVKKQKQNNGNGIKIGKQAVIASLVPFANPLADERMTKKVLKNVRKGKYLFDFSSVSKTNHTHTNPDFKPVVQHSALKRGVKEVVKALRKSLQPSPSTSLSSQPATDANSHSTSTSTSILPRPKLTHTLAPAIVILAADISPMDVISHIPVLCEDMHVPYLYVRSRAELGLASATKRPTSVVMAMRQAGKSKKDNNNKKKKDLDKDDGAEGLEEGKTEEEYKDVFEELLRIVEKAGRGVVI